MNFIVLFTSNWSKFVLLEGADATSFMSLYLRMLFSVELIVALNIVMLLLLSVVLTSTLYCPRGSVEFITDPASIVLPVIESFKVMFDVPVADRLKVSSGAAKNIILLFTLCADVSVTVPVTV